MVCPSKQSHDNKKGDHLPEVLGQTYADASQGYAQQTQNDNEASAETIRQNGHWDLSKSIRKTERRDQYPRLEIVQTKYFTKQGEQWNQDPRAYVMAEMGKHKLGNKVFSGYPWHL